MKSKCKLATFVATSLLVVAVGVQLYALPATWSLPRGRRPGIEALTLSQAAAQLRATGLAGWELVEAARALVGQRMHYCRRNSQNTAAKAFERGYGYCMQHAYALSGLLARLGVEARVAQAFRNRFVDGSVTSHAWVRVTVEGERRDIDPLFWDTERGTIAFTPLSPVTGINPLFKAFTWWGAPAVNAHRYYRTGKDL